MLFLVRNYELVKNREKTFLTASAAAAGTTLTVKAVNSNAWANTDYIIVGEIGSKNAEIVAIGAAVTSGTSLTVGALVYAHAIDEPVYRIDYNQIEFSRAATETGAKSVLVTNNIQPDDVYTRYEDTANTTGYGFSRFKNSTSGTFSAYSDAIPYTGYTAKSLGRMIKAVRRQLGEPDFKFITDEDITEELNEKQRDIAHERLWPFFENIRSASSVAYQREYDISSSASKVHAVTVDSDPIAKIDTHRFDTLFWDTSVMGAPTRVSQWNNKLRFYPIPDTSATATTLNGALSATATSITVVSTTGFAVNGRVIIDSEVVSYTNLSSTQLLGCIRGEENTTATTHTSTTAVTERNIIYTAHTEPAELVDTMDETAVPDPEVLIYGASAELAIGKLKDETLHDRLYNKYTAALEKLRDKFGRKVTSAFYRIKDRDEVVSDDSYLRDPNDYASITGA